MTLQEFNKKYIYKTDKERFNTSLDIWELPKDSDIIYGDCEPKVDEDLEVIRTKRSEAGAFVRANEVEV